MDVERLRSLFADAIGAFKSVPAHNEPNQQGGVALKQTSLRDAVVHTTACLSSLLEFLEIYAVEAETSARKDAAVWSTNASIVRLTRKKARAVQNAVDPASASGKEKVKVKRKTGYLFAPAPQKSEKRKKTLPEDTKLWQMQMSLLVHVFDLMLAVLKGESELQNRSSRPKALQHHDLVLLLSPVEEAIGQSRCSKNLGAAGLTVDSISQLIHDAKSCIQRFAAAIEEEEQQDVERRKLFDDNFDGDESNTAGSTKETEQLIKVFHATFEKGETSLAQSILRRLFCINLDESSLSADETARVAAQLHEVVKRFKSRKLASELLHASRRFMTGSDPYSLQLRHCLALDYFETDRLSGAQSECRAVLEGRMSILGREHPSTLQSALLLSHISLAQNDIETISECSALLNPSYIASLEHELFGKPEPGMTLFDTDTTRFVQIFNTVRLFCFMGDVSTAVNYAIQFFRDRLPAVEVDEHRQQGLRANILGDPTKGLAATGFGFSPLHLCAVTGYHIGIDTLIAKGADVDARNSTSWTALHLAVEKGHRESVHALLRRGASLSAPGRSNKTPLHIAIESECVAMVPLLLSHGALCTKVSVHGGDALHLAAAVGNEDIVWHVLNSGQCNRDKRNLDDKQAWQVALDKGHMCVVSALMPPESFSTSKHTEDH